MFHSRVLFHSAVALLAIAAIAMMSLISRAPFDGIAAHGKPLAELICDLTSVLASLICGGGGIAALRDAGRARHDERTWDLS